SIEELQPISVHTDPTRWPVGTGASASVDWVLNDVNGSLLLVGGIVDKLVVECSLRDVDFAGWVLSEPTSGAWVHATTVMRMNPTAIAVLSVAVYLMPLRRREQELGSETLRPSGSV